MHQNKEIDNINSPSHYISGRRIEPIDVIEEFNLCYHTGCVVKYISRAGRKGSALEDLYKAEWYLKREIEICDTDSDCFNRPRHRKHYSIREILEDWDIKDDLNKCMFLLLSSKLTDLEIYRDKLIDSFHHLNQSIKDYQTNASE